MAFMMRQTKITPTTFASFGFALSCVIHLGWSPSVRAEEPGTPYAPAAAPAPAVTPGTPAPSTAGPSDSAKVPSSKKANKPVRREKEAEGNKALNRFEADTVLKSQYKLNGKQLEIDPD